MRTTVLALLILASLVACGGGADDVTEVDPTVAVTDDTPDGVTASASDAEPEVAEATPGTTPEQTSTAPDDAPSGGADGLIVYSATAEGEVSAIVVARPDGTEVQRVPVSGRLVVALASGVPDRVWVRSRAADDTPRTDLLQVSSGQLIDLGLAEEVWVLPLPGSAQISGSRGVLLLPGESAVLVDLDLGTVQPISSVDSPRQASFAPDGNHLLVEGADGAVVVSAEDVSDTRPLEGLRTVGWLDDGQALLIADRDNAQRLDLRDGSSTPVALQRPLAVLPSSEQILTLDGDRVVVASLDGSPGVTVAPVIPSGLVLDPGGAGIVGEVDEQLSWFPTAGGEPIELGPDGLIASLRPGPAGPRAAWFSASAGRGQPLIGVDLATGEHTRVSPEEGGDPQGFFDGSGMRLADDGRSGVITFVTGQGVQPVHVDLDRPPTFLDPGEGGDGRGAPSPDGERLVVGLTTAAGGVVTVRTLDGEVIAEIGPGIAPTWVAVDGRTP